MDENNIAPMNSNPVLVVAHTPGIPARYEILLRKISFLLSANNQGKSYECRSNQMRMFLIWSKAENCLFFEWQEEEERMVCWMHNIRGNSYIKFLVNPAIEHGINDVAVKKPSLAFSFGFEDESWASVKTMLTTMFGSPEKKDLLQHDHMLVFTRVDSFLCIRNFKIDDIPKVDCNEIPLVLTEVNLFFCFKLLDAHGNINQVPDMSENQLHLRPTVFYTAPSGQQGSYTPHLVNLNNRVRQFFLKDHHNQSLVGICDGFNLPLDHLLSKEPILKMKHIMGSQTNKQSVFLRNRFKLVFRSVVIKLRDLFASGMCLDVERGASVNNLLIKGTDIMFYGLKTTNYTEQLAKGNLAWLEELISSCFPSEMIPIEVTDAFVRLLKPDEDPLNSLQELSEDCLWLRAEERRTLLITHHSEYMTNFAIRVEPKADKKDDPDADMEDDPDADMEDDPDADMEDDPDVGMQADDGTSFEDCPYIHIWRREAEDNEYLMQVCNLLEDATGDAKKGPEGDAEKGLEGDAEKGTKVDAKKGTKGDPKKGTKGDGKKGTKGGASAIADRIGKKLGVSGRNKHVRKLQKKRAKVPKGIIQFDSMRNFEMHMPEKAMKDGIRPFRLGLSDYILTSYYPQYLSFVHRRMSLLLRKRKLEKK